MTICSPLARLLVFTGCMQIALVAVAQPSQPDAEKWADALALKGQKGNDYYHQLDSILFRMDSARIFQFLSELGLRKTANPNGFLARFDCLKARYLYYKNIYDKNTLGDNILYSPLKDRIKELLAGAMDHAYKSEDDQLIVFISSWYAKTVSQFGELGLAVMYATNSIDLGEKIAFHFLPYDYQFFAEMLYKAREYDNSIKYAGKAAQAWKISNEEGSKRFAVLCLNTVALGYHRQNKYDSALLYYDQALQLAKKSNIPVWMGIVSGNMAQIYYVQKKYDTSYRIFKYDYETSKASGLFDNAANSLQWAARTHLALGNKAAALKEVREALQLLKTWPDANYQRNAYFTTTQIFREMGNYDSAFYYNNLYSALNDSLEKLVATSSLAISKARLNDETSRYDIQNLNNEKKAQLFYRDIIVAGIILLSAFVLLMVNRQRLKTKLKMEKVEQEKILIEQEIHSAREQLQMFTENIIEKANLIEKLETQAKTTKSASEQHAIIAELTQYTILTEQDWYTFKSLFEKIHPGFFMKLKGNFPDITQAEQRMAALTLLPLTSKQIASMLGISTDGVHKSRQRLRLRFNVGPDTNLDELIAGL